MAGLEKLIPAEELAARFPDVTIKHYGLNDLERLFELKGPTMHEIGMTVWDLAVTRETDDIDPKALADFVDRQDARVVNQIKRELGREVLFDLYYGHATLKVDGKKRTVSEVMLAHVYPNELHLADIEFSDPHRPIAKKDRQYQYTHYRGLGLLQPFIDDVVKAATHMECNAVTLTAATADHVGLFAKCGFRVPNTLRAKFGMQHGVSIPMQYDLNPGGGWDDPDGD